MPKAKTDPMQKYRCQKCGLLYQDKTDGVCTDTAYCEAAIKRRNAPNYNPRRITI